MASDQEISQINAAGLIVATIIHEIGNPLSIALSAFNVMQLHRGNADIFNEAIDDAGQALQMMQNVLNATRGLVRGDVDVEDVSMAQLSLEMSRYNNQAHKQFIDELDQNHKVKANIYGLVLALHNLIKNSFDASADANVYLKSEINKDGEINIIVKDDGPGMSADESAKIFGNFSSHSERDGRIRGLGMQITHEMITKMHGRIVCESTLGIGTTFVISLPRQ